MILRHFITLPSLIDTLLPYSYVKEFLFIITLNSKWTCRTVFTVRTTARRIAASSSRSTMTASRRWPAVWAPPSRRIRRWRERSAPQWRSCPWWPQPESSGTRCTVWMVRCFPSTGEEKDSFLYLEQVGGWQAVPGGPGVPAACRRALSGCPAGSGNYLNCYFVPVCLKNLW